MIPMRSIPTILSPPRPRALAPVRLLLSVPAATGQPTGRLGSSPSKRYVTSRVGERSDEKPENERTVMRSDDLTSS